MTPSNEFTPEFTLKPADDGRVFVTVLLPSDLVRDYCHFLESLSSFFQTVNRKTSYLRKETDAATKAILEARAISNVESYRSRLVKSFDAYTAQGLDRKAAVKRVAADLRAESHPWSAVELVRSQLVELGRGGRAGRPRLVQP